MSPWRTLQWRRPGAVELRARQRQHVERQVDAEAALDLRPEQFEHPAGAGAEIEQRAERPVGERRRGSRPRPPRRRRAACGCGPTRRRARRNSACAAAARAARTAASRSRSRASTGSAGSSRAISVARERRPPPPRSASRKNAQAPSRIALDQAGLGQQLEMARDARLRLAQDVGQVRDRQLGLGRAAPGCAAASPRRRP